jgi:hypothetical protein
LDDYLHWVWPALPAPTTLAWSDSPVVALREGVPWIYRPVKWDPSCDSRGTVLPREVRARLKKLTIWAVPFHRLAIAQELDRDGPVREWLPSLEQGPRPCPDDRAAELMGEVPVHPFVARLVRVLDHAIAGATFTARIPASLARTAKAIVFGVIGPEPPRHGELCLWYPLADWRW